MHIIALIVIYMIRVVMSCTACYLHIMHKSWLFSANC